MTQAKLAECLISYNNCMERLYAPNDKNKNSKKENMFGSYGVLDGYKKLLNYIANNHLPIIKALAKNDIDPVEITADDILNHLKEFPKDEKELELLNQVLKCAEKTIKESEDPKKIPGNVAELSRLSNVSYQMAEINPNSVESNSISELKKAKKYEKYEKLGKFLLVIGLIAMIAAIASICAFAFIPTFGGTAFLGAMMIPLTITTYVGLVLGMGIHAYGARQAQKVTQKVDNLSTRIELLKGRMKDRMFFESKCQQNSKQNNQGGNIEMRNLRL